MYERILVPLDGSELAEAALPYAEEFTGRLGSEVILMSVAHSLEVLEQRGYQSYIQRTVEIVKEGAGRYLGKAVGGVMKVESAILIGNPAEEIVDFADKMGIDLVVMATHGRSGITRWALGSVADKVLRAIKQPIVLIRASGSHPEVCEKGILGKLLVPLDGSKEGEAVVPYVEELASKLGAEVVFLQVVPLAYHVEIAGDMAVQVPYMEEEMEPLKVSAKSYLERVGGVFESKGIITKYEVRIGVAAHKIIELADEVNVDMVAMSTHGRSGVGRWVFGSVAEKIAHSANIPVLLVRAPGAGMEAA